MSGPPRASLSAICAGRRLPTISSPLLFLTGASGAGKTTLYRQLVGRVREAILIDGDLLWWVNPAHDDPGSWIRAEAAAGA